MHVDVLIVGQGICGTMLSWFLKKEGKTFLIIDEEKESSSSLISAGIINPVTGRRYVTTWMIEDLLSFAKTTYAELSDFLQASLITPKSIIDFFPSPQMREAFIERVAEDDTYLHAFPDQNSFNPFFNYEFGCGEICPCYVVNFQSLLRLWRNYLQDSGAVLNERFETAEVIVSAQEIAYRNFTADKIVFCDGINSLQNRWFKLLPFSANKGECLIIETEALPSDFIFKKGTALVPISEPNQYWVGSSYQWEFSDDLPSEQFLQKTTAHLNQWLKKPFKVLEHKAAVRPATLERRPFVGFHPVHSSLGILNGMGTKGASLAPFFANQLVQNMVYNLPIADEANVSRFNKILSTHSS